MYVSINEKILLLWRSKFQWLLSLPSPEHTLNPPPNCSLFAKMQIFSSKQSLLKSIFKITAAGQAQVPVPLGMRFKGLHDYGHTAQARITLS